MVEVRALLQNKKYPHVKEWVDLSEGIEYVCEVMDYDGDYPNKRHIEVLELEGLDIPRKEYPQLNICELVDVVDLCQDIESQIGFYQEFIDAYGYNKAIELTYGCTLKVNKNVKDIEEYGRRYIESMGGLEELPREILYEYFDYKRYTNDIFGKNGNFVQTTRGVVEILEVEKY